MEIFLKTANDIDAPKTETKKNYWDDSVDQYIVDYIQEKDHIKKSIIFEKNLYKPISKLIESIVYRYKLHKFEHDGIDDIKQQCMVHIIETVLPKYDVTRQKSYAYIGTSVRRYLIQKIRKHSDKIAKHISIDMDLNDTYGDGDESRTKDNTVLNSIKHSYVIDDDNLSKELLNRFLEKLREEVELISTINEKSTKSWMQFLNSFILICETNHGLSFIDNKIIFYNSLKKINEFSTSKNYKYMVILKQRFKTFTEEYLNNN